VQEADTLTKEVVDVLQDLAEVNGATQADDIDEDMDFEGSYEEDDAALADTDNGKGAGRGDSDEEVKRRRHAQLLHRRKQVASASRRYRQRLKEQRLQKEETLKTLERQLQEKAAQLQNVNVAAGLPLSGEPLPMFQNHTQQVLATTRTAANGAHGGPPLPPPPPPPPPPMWRGTLPPTSNVPPPPPPSSQPPVTTTSGANLTGLAGRMLAGETALPAKRAFAETSIPQSSGGAFNAPRLDDFAGIPWRADTTNTKQENAKFEIAFREFKEAYESMTSALFEITSSAECKTGAVVVEYEGEWPVVSNLSNVNPEHIRFLSSLNRARMCKQFLTFAFKASNGPDNPVMPPPKRMPQMPQMPPKPMPQIPQIPQMPQMPQIPQMPQMPQMPPFNSMARQAVYPAPAPAISTLLNSNGAAGGAALPPGFVQSAMAAMPAMQAAATQSPQHFLNYFPPLVPYSHLVQTQEQFTSWYSGLVKTVIDSVTPDTLNTLVQENENTLQGLVNGNNTKEPAGDLAKESESLRRTILETLKLTHAEVSAIPRWYEKFLSRKEEFLYCLRDTMKAQTANEEELIRTQLGIWSTMRKTMLNEFRDICKVSTMATLLQFRSDSYDESQRMYFRVSVHPPSYFLSNEDMTPQGCEHLNIDDPMMVYMKKVLVPLLNEAEDRSLRITDDQMRKIVEIFEQAKDVRDRVLKALVPTRAWLQNDVALARLSSQLCSPEGEGKEPKLLHESGHFVLSRILDYVDQFWDRLLGGASDVNSILTPFQARFVELNTSDRTKLVIAELGLLGPTQ